MIKSGHMPQEDAHRRVVVLLGSDADHKKDWIAKLRKHLSPFQDHRTWTPADAPAGARKDTEALEITRADVLVLVLSADFVAEFSDPPTLEVAARMNAVRAAMRGGRCTILRVNASANSADELAELKPYPWGGTPDRPLEGLESDDLEAELKTIAARIVGRRPPAPTERWMGFLPWAIAAVLVLGVSAGLWVFLRGAPVEPEVAADVSPQVRAPTPFPRDRDLRPIIRVAIADDTPATLRAKSCRTKAPRPGARPPSLTAGAAPPPEPSTPAKPCVDPTTSATIAEVVADRLQTALPLFRFDAGATSTSDLVLHLGARPREKGRAWPTTAIELVAELQVGGERVTQPRTLCVFEPNTAVPRENLRPIAERLASCEANIDEAVKRWSRDVQLLLAQVPFMTEVDLDATSGYVSTQFVSENLVETQDQLDAAFFAVRHPRDGDLRFRVCAKEQIGGYLSESTDLSVSCRTLRRDAADLKDISADRVFLSHWGGPH